MEREQRKHKINMSLKRQRYASTLIRNREENIRGNVIKIHRSKGVVMASAGNRILPCVLA